MQISQRSAVRTNGWDLANLDEGVMKNIVLSLGVLVFLGTMCAATVSSHPVASTLAQAEGFTVNNSLDVRSLPEGRFSVLLSP